MVLSTGLKSGDNRLGYEAPGLENFFFSSDEELETVRCQLGLINILMAYKRQFPLLPIPLKKTNDGQQPTIDDEKLLSVLQEVLPPISEVLYPIYPEEPSGNRSRALWLLPSGLRSDNYFSVYVQAVQSFDWAEFYTQFKGEVYFDWLRAQLLSSGLADVVLIDSRTGITEMGGVCTRQLADVVVAFCVPNTQNVTGIASMVKSFLRAEILQARKNRPLQVVVVPARLENAEIGARNIFKDLFLKKFDSLTPASFQRVNRTFWDLKIPYIPQYAYTEKLAIGASDRKSQAEELEEAYKTLAISLALLLPEESVVRKSVSTELEQAFGRLLLKPRVLLSYARSDGEDFATQLRKDLEKEGISLWSDPVNIEEGRERWSQVITALDNVEFVVVAITPEALRSPFIKKEWRNARQRGLCVYPVIAHPNLDLPSLPRWMRDVHWYQLDLEWQKFLNDLNARCLQRPIPFMVEDLPPDFVPRPAEFEGIISRLLDVKREVPVAITAALRGAGGYGKTTLAKAICHDQRIQDAFDDGILWVTLGENPNILGRLEDLNYILSREHVGFSVVEAAAARFVELLGDRDILFVIDDVWSTAHLKPFLQGGKRCARLITTRNDRILPSEAPRIAVDAMLPIEAIQLLIAGITDRIDPVNKTQELYSLAARLGNWPLLLALVNSVLRERMSVHNQSLSDALTFINRTLDKRGITAFDTANIQDRAQTVAETLKVSFKLLRPKEFAQLRRTRLFFLKTLEFH